MQTHFLKAFRVLSLALLAAMLHVPAAMAQDDDDRRPAAATARPGPWFGLTLPPQTGEAPAVMVGPRAARAVTVPPGEPAAPEFEGARIKADVNAIVAFSHESRQRREIGSGQMWGRVTGFPSSSRTVAWSVEQFRTAGIADVKVQPIRQQPNASLWLPLSWQVKLLADPSFGPGTADVVLHSALPLSPSNLPSGTLTAPLVFVGTGNPSIANQIDVKGKIAVQLVVPQGHMLFERGSVSARSRNLIARGAVGVFNLVRLPGNELSRDFSNCGNPCFNVGGNDGFFLEQLFDRAAEAGAADRLRAEITLRTQTFSGLSAENGVAVIPGSQGAGAETIILNAHVDGWFDGAGDNADGLAVLMALARHFNKPENRLGRTLVLVASAGHHSPGMNGPSNFVEANPDLSKRAVMMINIEHVAQRNFSPARTTAADGYRQAVADLGEAPIVPGVANGGPLLQQLVDQGAARYGVNFISTPSTVSSGETGGYSDLDAARITIIQAPPLYHTTGEVADVISTPGLERMARFLAFFVKEVDKAPRASLVP